MFGPPPGVPPSPTMEKHIPLSKDEIEKIVAVGNSFNHWEFCNRETLLLDMGVDAPPPHPPQQSKTPLSRGDLLVTAHDFRPRGRSSGDERGETYCRRGKEQDCQKEGEAREKRMGYRER